MSKKGTRKGAARRERDFQRAIKQGGGRVGRGCRNVRVAPVI